MKPITVKTEYGATVEIKCNAGGVVLIRHSRFDADVWAELREFSRARFECFLGKDQGGNAKESYINELIPKLGGYVIIGGREFRLDRKELDAIKEAIREQSGSVPNLSCKPRPLPATSLHPIVRVDLAPPTRKFGRMKISVGKKYISATGSTTRVIERIDGDDICWCDETGSGRCTKGTFRKWAGRPLNESAESPASPPVGGVSTNQHATNKLLESYLILQNVIDAWTKNLDQTADYYSAVLTPTQKRVVAAAKEQSAICAKQLQQLQDELTQRPPPAEKI